MNELQHPDQITAQDYVGLHQTGACILSGSLGVRDYYRDVGEAPVTRTPRYIHLSENTPGGAGGWPPAPAREGWTQT